MAGRKSRIKRIRSRFCTIDKHFAGRGIIADQRLLAVAPRANLKARFARAAGCSSASISYTALNTAIR